MATYKLNAGKRLTETENHVPVENTSTERRIHVRQKIGGGSLSPREMMQHEIVHQSRQYSVLRPAYLLTMVRAISINMRIVI